MPILQKFFVVQANASDGCIGMRWLIRIGDFMMHSCLWKRATWNEPCLKNLEALSMGVGFVFLSDHQSVWYSLTQPIVWEKHVWQANFIAAFSFQIQHTPSKEIVVANSLSRRPQAEEEDEVVILKQVIYQKKKYTRRTLCTHIFPQVFALFYRWC